MSHCLKAINIKKSFFRKQILNGINLSFESGTITGLVGENGSGKTVFMKILIGLMRSDSGSVFYDDGQLKKDFDYLPSVGFIIENPGFYSDMTAYENLKMLAEIRNSISDQEIDYWIRKVGLSNDDKIVGDYSLGMTQRLGIAQALMEDPEVLILDEVSNSLDDEGIDLVHDLLKLERNKGKIIILSSHSRYDIDDLCDKVYRFRNGALIDETKP